MVGGGHRRWQTPPPRCVSFPCALPAASHRKPYVTRGLPPPPPLIVYGEQGEDDDDDRISVLPDELLHDILAHLRCARAAARTSVLSRRWRHVWRDVPQLVLLASGPDAPQPPTTSSFPDIVDAALDAHAAPTMERLLIALPSDVVTILPAARAAPWLRFAAARVAGALLLLVPPRLTFVPPPVAAVRAQQLELPACARAQTITLKLQDAWLLRPVVRGVFAALTSLTILYGRMDGGELSALVSSARCPCLRDLRLRVTLVHADDNASDGSDVVVSVRSDTLRSLWFCILSPHSSPPPMIEVVAPRLEKLCAYYAFKARFSVPKLSELVWTGYHSNDRHQFVNVGRRLQRLDITPDLFSGVGLRCLLHRFDEVDELGLTVHIPRGTAGYESFLNETSKLPKCKTMEINLELNGHGLAPSMFHLLRNCTGANKVSIQLLDRGGESQYSCPLSCPCDSEESCRVDDIALGSLEEVQISSCTSYHEELEFVELLSKCNATSLKHLAIYYSKWKFLGPLESKEICKKMHGMYGPNVKVEFYVVGKGRCVRFNWRDDPRHVSTKC